MTFYEDACEMARILNPEPKDRHFCFNCDKEIFEDWEIEWEMCTKCARDEQIEDDLTRDYKESQGIG